MIEDRQVNIKFLRSLSGLTPRYPTYDADSKTALSIVEWCKDIQLANKHCRLKVQKEAIFQFPTQGFNTYTYVISIDAPEIIKNLLQERSVT